MDGPRPCSAPRREDAARCAASGARQRYFADGCSADGHSFAFSRRVARVLLLSFAPDLKQGRREGRAPDAPEVPRVLKNAHGGGRQVRRSPGLPCAMVFTVSFVLSSGSVALLPPSPCGRSMRAPVGRRIAARLDARTPGAGTTRLLRPHTSPLGPPRLACAHREGHARTLSAPCRTAPVAAHGCPPCSSIARRRRRGHRIPARVS